jgi:4-amino-4-deoxy-L-arabinose transferase-like glycosyltransferase
LGNNRLTIQNILTHPYFQIGVLITLLFSLYCITLSTVPFHPDEATTLFKSGDVKDLISNPSALAYRGQDPIDLSLHYRLIDPPINSLILGLVQSIADVPFSQTDWNWTLDWNANQQSGSLPSVKSLHFARLSFLVLFPFTCLFLYLAAKNLSNHWTGLFAVLFFALNPIILLHSRRAMAEGVFVFFACIFLYLIFDKKKHLISVPILMAFCLNSKQTALFLLPTYVLYFLLLNSKQKISHWIKTTALFLLIPLVLTYLLNPVAWLDPLQTIQAAVHERTALNQSTQAYLQEYYPERVSQSVVLRLALVHYHAFFEPIALADTANYQAQQQLSFDRYSQIPLQHQNRSSFLATLQIIVLLSVFLIQGLNWWRNRKKLPENFTRWVLFYSGFGFSLLGLSLLPGLYQRYIVILVPFIAMLNGWIPSQIILRFGKTKPA